MTLRHVDTGTQATILDRPGRVASGTGCTGDLVTLTVQDAAANNTGTLHEWCLQATPRVDAVFKNGFE